MTAPVPDKEAATVRRCPTCHTPWRSLTPVPDPALVCRSCGTNLTHYIAGEFLCGDCHRKAALVTVRADDLAYAIRLFGVVENDRGEPNDIERAREDRLRAALVARSAPPVDEPALFMGGASLIPVDEEQRIEAVCEVMHDAYEAAAAQTGWETQERSRKPWADVPEANKATMRIAVAAALTWTKENPQ